MSEQDRLVNVPKGVLTSDERETYGDRNKDIGIFITIMDTFRDEIYVRELTEDDKRALAISVRKFLEPFDLDVDKCAWFYSDREPEIRSMEDIRK